MSRSWTRASLSRRTFLAGSLAVAGATLAACAPVPGAPAAPAAQPEAGAKPAPEEVITLVFHDRGGSHGEWHESRVPLFEEQNPGLKLVCDQLVDMDTKVYAMAASGTIGDACWAYTTTIVAHVVKEVVRELDDIMAAKNFDTGAFWPTAMDAMSVKGKVYAIPNHGHYGTVTYYYNEKLYDESGVAMPNPDWTTDELVAGAQKITKAPDIWGFRAMGGGSEHMTSYLRIFGGEVLNEDGTECMFLDERSVEALKWLYDLKYTYEVDPCVCGDETRNNFVAGKVGCYNWTTGYASEFARIEDWTFDWDCTIGPVGPHGDRGSHVAVAGFCVTKQSKHPHEAFQILDFFSTKEDGIEHVYGGAGSPGARDDVWDSARLNEFHPIFGVTKAHYPEGPGPWLYPKNGRTAEFFSVMDNNLQGIWTGKLGFDEGVQTLYDNCQEILEKEEL